MTGPICVRFHCDCLVMDAHPLNAVHWSRENRTKKRISLVGQIAELHTESYPCFSRWFFNGVRVPFIGRLGKLYKPKWIPLVGQLTELHTQSHANQKVEQFDQQRGIVDGGVIQKPRKKNRIRASSDSRSCTPRVSNSITNISFRKK